MDRRSSRELYRPTLETNGGPLARHPPSVVCTTWPVPPFRRVEYLGNICGGGDFGLDISSVEDAVRRRQSSKRQTARHKSSKSRRSPVQVLGDPRSILTKRFREQAYSPSGLRQIVVLEVDVEQVDVPRQFDIVHDVGFDNLPGDGQSRVLRVVVNVAVAGLRSFSYSSARSRSNNSGENRSPAFTPTASSSAVKVAFLCSHSQRMLRRISPVAMSSIRYRTSSLPKKSAGLSAAAWKSRPGRHCHTGGRR